MVTEVKEEKPGTTRNMDESHTLKNDGRVYFL